MLNAYSAHGTSGSLHPNHVGLSHSHSTLIAITQLAYGHIASLSSSWSSALQYMISYYEGGEPIAATNAVARCYVYDSDDESDEDDQSEKSTMYT